jgi:hypothetical protein
MFHFPKEVLLIEIERYCQLPDCGARNVISLTKQEAIEYRGFECHKCQQWNQDTLTPDMLPEQWADGLWLQQDETGKQLN